MIKAIYMYILIVGLIVSVGNADAVTHYVNIHSTSPTSPYTSAATAATNIQAAVDSAVSGDTVLVADGTYKPASEILVTKAIIITSVNGSKTTTVDGGGTHRCFNLGESACRIEGLLIMNGYTMTAGSGISCENTTPIISNCIFTRNSSMGGDGGGLREGTATNCLFVKNYSYRGGGMFKGVANNCSFIENNSILGGGMFKGIANNCSFVKNVAYYGGGMHQGTANNCSFVKNYAHDFGGGIAYGKVNNCIVWYNTAINYGNNLYSSTAHYTCSPDVTHGADGCITNNPNMASFDHLLPTSPCIGAGSSSYHFGTDIDGETWQLSPSMGCDEYNAITTGDIDLSLEIFNLVGVNASIPITHSIVGPSTQSTLDFGDGTILTNQIKQISHVWTSLGTYDVVLTAYNAGSDVSVTQQVVVTDAVQVQHISPLGNDLNDGLSWATPKQTIQAGVDSITMYGGTVLVSNGTYIVSDKVLVNKPIVVKSLNGADVTIVDGGGVHRCFNLSTPCRIEGFTIKNGHITGADAGGAGGGIYCASITPIVANCVFTNNFSKHGGGMFNGTANNCSFINNISSWDGGGMFYGTANNCSFVNNSAKYGGGKSHGIANNCIAWHNTATTSKDDLDTVIAHYTCSPDVAHGSDGCITNAPLFVSSTDVHIQKISLCIGAGSIDYISGTDIDGNAWKNPPAMGCDETSPSVQYVSLTGTDANNGMSWKKARKTIQSASDFVAENGTVLVTNGTYASTSEVLVSNPITIKSVNGLDVTIIDGGGTHRCFNLGGVACRIEGFTIKNGNTPDSGGGIYCENSTPTVSVCKFIGNVAAWHGGGMNGGTANNCKFVNNSVSWNGGGMHEGKANNCFFINNSAIRRGGGISEGTANNCLFINNSADFGGGIYDGKANNCIVWDNTASTGDNIFAASTHNTCSPDGVIHGVNGCITNAPAFMNKTHDDYHLRCDSPCLDFGNNSYIVGTVDFDGHPRIVNNTVDMGCYEKELHDIDHDELPDRWEFRYFGTLTSVNPGEDSDNDHQNNLAEYIVGTDPTDASSYFHITKVDSETNSCAVTWSPCIRDRTYTVLWTDNLATNFTAISTNLYFPKNKYTDALNNSDNTGFYKVEVSK